MKHLKEAFVVHLKIPIYHISGKKYQSGQVNQNSPSTQEFGKYKVQMTPTAPLRSAPPPFPRLKAILTLICVSKDKLQK